MTITNGVHRPQRLPFHLSPLDFSLSDLEALTSEQLALVQYHAQSDETTRVKAEIIFWKRREQDHAILEATGTLQDDEADSPPPATANEELLISHREPVKAYKLDLSKLKPLSGWNPQTHEVENGAADQDPPVETPLPGSPVAEDNGAISQDHGGPVEKAVETDVSMPRASAATVEVDAGLAVEAVQEAAVDDIPDIDAEKNARSAEASVEADPATRVKLEPVEEELIAGVSASTTLQVPQQLSQPDSETEEGEIRSEDDQPAAAPAVSAPVAPASSEAPVSLHKRRISIPLPFKPKSRPSAPVAGVADPANVLRSDANSSRSVEAAPVAPKIVKSQPIGTSSNEKARRSESAQVSETARGKRRERSPEREREKRKSRDKEEDKHSRGRTRSTSSLGSSRSRTRSRKRTSRKKRSRPKERDRSRSRAKKRRRRRSYSTSSDSSDYSSSSSRSRSSSYSTSSFGSYSSSSRSRSRSTRRRPQPQPVYYAYPPPQGYPAQAHPSHIYPQALPSPVYAQAATAPVSAAPAQATYAAQGQTYSHAQPPRREEDMTRTEMAHMYRGATSNPEEKRYVADMQRVRASPPRPVHNSTHFPGEQSSTYGSSAYGSTASNGQSTGGAARYHPDRERMLASRRDSPPRDSYRTPPPRDARPRDGGWGGRSDYRQNGADERSSWNGGASGGRSPVRPRSDDYGGRPARPPTRRDDDDGWGSSRAASKPAAPPECRTSGAQSAWGASPPAAGKHALPAKPSVWDEPGTTGKKNDPWADDEPAKDSAGGVWGASPEATVSQAKVSNASVWD